MIDYISDSKKYPRKENKDDITETGSILEEINDQYQEYMDGLTIRNRRLKLLVSFDEGVIDEVLSILEENRCNSY